MPSPKQPRSRRERPAKPALSREAIVAAATRLVEREDGERLTIRRLAEELDTGSASLYVYVRNTGELYALVLDEKIGTLELSWDPARTPWLDRLTELLLAYVELLAHYPSLARSALFSRARGEHSLELLELLLRLLDAGGASPTAAAWGVDILLQTATATAFEHSGHERADADAEDLAELAAVLRDASLERFPHIARAGAELVSGSGADRGRWAFAAIANGIVATPRP